MWKNAPELEMRVGKIARLLPISYEQAQLFALHLACLCTLTLIRESYQRNAAISSMISIASLIRNSYSSTAPATMLLPLFILTLLSVFTKGHIKNLVVAC